ncbi:BON domain-containing protein [Paraburkholderia rhizosphaerae]|uniref:Osmotically-inducible protein OsmY n=1 Tax=Paraburkholderia rhizosphaerae TaxID=480658 RepID=A0A4R8LVV6_9BURK|nr:BON domain-containing protein [Paraburkholderia rhizosphaerae]TDY50975.1 osmotically-inducible protein OsmY [Paraburkholderia rhizosphaerae]
MSTVKPDSQIRQEVEDELAGNAAIDANRIGVCVSNGIVTLSGNVASYAEKLAAEKSAMRVSGVDAVVVKLDVSLPQNDRRTDEDIAIGIRGILDWIAGLDEYSVKVKVEKGCVTLTGELHDAYRSRVAEQHIAHMRGVVGVANQIRIRGEASSVDIEQNIRKAIQRHTERELKHIGIQIEQGKVALSGRVTSPAERALVRGAALGTPGVTAVDDRLRVA